MQVKLFTPKQVALALGVSESSIKRWVDSGRLTAAKTVGGHRKVTLPSIAAFVRETGHHLEHPELLGLVAAGAAQHSRCDAIKPLFEALVEGREAVVREVVLGAYQRGATVVELGDHLLGPAFGLIGAGWAAGTVAIHQERRACETAMAVLHELRRLMPEPNDDAPLALVATPHQDFAEVPIRLVELVLLAEGWRVVAAGSGLPLEEVRDATLARQPRLVCLSATHLNDPVVFLEDYRQTLAEPTRVQLGVAHALGGSALREIDLGPAGADLAATSLAELAAFGQRLRQQQPAA
jgi:MerR family transcriptional regulator, light-induced transcriptional regulator